ncbi:hypothetical protein FBZ84_14113 [Azospirillum baldaniorum]|uniref:NAD/NADP transhydrogenase alpha subunit-like protein n=1 Tax=Azospirillum baldaniorum TaxID=1064539 RepID=UPI0011AD5BAE|nr:NAD/NADP transhydrogenase alpha subunit-like protein [Azospirillum baldaniorum]TWA51885.1 hypothetical protein FBZ84_14113 [Azospirillum baldaniorum]
MRDLLTHKDAMGTPSAVLSVSDSRYALVLAAGTGKMVSVPNDAKTVLFASTGPFWVQYGTAAILPVADDVSGVAPELAPAARRLDGTTLLGLVAPSDCTVSLTFFG